MDNSSNIILASLPGTLVDLRKRTGLARSTVSRAVGKLHANGKCRIAKYVESAVLKNAPLMPYYVRGRGADAPCPVHTRPKSKGPADGLLRARMKAIADADRVSKTRDPLLWWCFDVSVVF